jgi:tRNA-2-methylthio-N6-dimethylallyladenosine synthase
MGDSAELADLATLIEYIAEVPGIERIRYTTSHPKEMTRRLIETYGRVEKLVSHLHLPVQSGSDRILAAMKRGYTALEYKSIVRAVRAVRPGLSVTSDFIIGFPGESDADFAQTMRLVEEVRFDGAFNFAYSPRPGTPAAALADQVPPETKQARLEALQTVLDAQYREFSEAMVGTVERVLVTSRSVRTRASSRREPGTTAS